jgi:rhodanese-related sulfurtransferase
VAKHSKTAWLPGAATALAIVSCYGTVLLLGALSLLGVSVAINERAWAGAISGFAGVAAILIAASGRKRRSFGPTLVATIGFAFILWAMYGAYTRLVEISGFALLVAATFWDLRLPRRDQDTEGDAFWIEAAELANRVGREPRPLVIDVREPDEFAGPLGHIVTARNLPVGELQRRLAEIDAHKDKPLILVCRSNKRSSQAASLLGAARFRQVRVLRGGMERWREAGLPVEDRIG